MGLHTTVEAREIEAMLPVPRLSMALKIDSRDFTASLCADAV